jgi:SAM-dependent methyltransferase
MTTALRTVVASRLRADWGAFERRLTALSLSVTASLEWLRIRDSPVIGAEKIYAAMRQSEMNNWDGGGDPAAIGAANFTSIIENLALRRDAAVLDFGCGIGRISILLAEFLNEGGQVVGSDIVPGQIHFCREQFAHVFANATFYCLQASNPLYAQYVTATADATPAVNEELFFQKYRDAFDLIVAFSVFTHFDPTMAAHYLKSLRDITKPSGHLFLTWFLGHPNNPVESRLGPEENFQDRSGNLLSAIFSLAAVEQLSSSAGLLIERISYGYWRDWPVNIHGLKAQNGQDIVILRRPVELPIEFDANRYLAINKDVADAGVDPVKHYLALGYRQGRRFQ